MNDLKWIKIAVDIFDDEKIMLLDVLPNNDSILVIWFKILCLAGKQNNSGVFFLKDGVPLTAEMLAVILRRPSEIVRTALAEFEKLGLIETINGTVTIPNWEKHQSIDKMDAMKKTTRERVNRYRDRQKQIVGNDCNVTPVTPCNVTVTPCNVTPVTPCNVTYRYNDSVTVTPCNALDKNREDKNRKEEEVEVVVDGDNDDERPDFNTVQVYATSNLSYMTPTHMEELNDFTNDLPDEVIRFAIDQACGKGIRTWAFVRKVLSAWIDAGVKSLGDAKAESERHSSSKSKPATQDYQQHDRIDYANFEFYDPLKEM